MPSAERSRPIIATSNSDSSPKALLQILSAMNPKLVWQSFGSWIRTVRPGLAPSEQVVAIALRNTFPEFLAIAAKTVILVKFLRDRLDLSRTEGTSLAA